MQASTEKPLGHVVLSDGYSVPLPALQLLWNLEARGFSLDIDPREGALVVRPRSRISPEDDRQIRQHRDSLRALVLLCQEAIQ